MQLVQSIIFSFFVSFVILSSHLFFCLSSGRVNSGFYLYTLLPFFLLAFDVNGQTSLIYELLCYLLYRVSIKSFPGYKHLLPEKYVEYKHIFLPLLKLVSKILCHVFIVMLQLHNLLVSK